MGGVEARVKAPVKKRDGIREHAKSSWFRFGFLCCCISLCFFMFRFKISESRCRCGDVRRMWFSWFLIFSVHWVVPSQRKSDYFDVYLDKSADCLLGMNAKCEEKQTTGTRGCLLLIAHHDHKCLFQLSSSFWVYERDKGIYILSPNASRSDVSCITTPENT